MTAKLPIAAALALLGSTAVSGQIESAPVAPPALNLEQETAVRCGAAFAIVSAEQARGSTLAAGWPVLGTRGREFFVRTGARLMDETGATRPQVQALFANAARSLRADSASLPGRLTTLRQPCLTLLDLTVPAA